MRKREVAKSFMLGLYNNLHKLLRASCWWNKGGKAEQKKAGLVSELDSLQHTLILWFFGIYTNPPTFWGPRVDITPASAAHRLSKTEAEQKSPYSRVAQNNQTCP